MNAEASEAFQAYQRVLVERIQEIETRIRRVQKGDDILPSVITDGRHSAIDMRLVRPGHDNEPHNKLNKLIAKVHHIWRETAEWRYRRSDGTPYPIPGAGQLIFSDLGTISVEAKRGFSAYRWIKQQLIELGVPPSEIAFMQDFRRSADRQRLFNDVNAGRIRILIGSSDTMGTGVNVQQRLKALHHLDVPWLPSQIEQREGRVERQGNQNEEIELYASATFGSMDATMWQSNERKARFIAAALSGDRSIRMLEDAGSQANQFAIAKAIASGDARLIQKAGLEGEIARLERQRAAHIDDQHNIRRQVSLVRADRQRAQARVAAIGQDITRQTPTRGDAFAMEIEGRSVTERKIAGTLLLSKLRLAGRAREARTWSIGRFGGFDLAGSVHRSFHGKAFEAELVLRRTDYDQEIAVDDDLTPLGLISRLEHILERFAHELEEQRRRARDAASRLEGYEARRGEDFPLQLELDAKRARLAENPGAAPGRDGGGQGGAVSRPAPQGSGAPAAAPRPCPASRDAAGRSGLPGMNGRRRATRQEPIMAELRSVSGDLPAFGDRCWRVVSLAAVGQVRCDRSAHPPAQP